MPTNRAVDWLRSPRGLKWAIPMALIATPTYLGLTALAIEYAARPGLGWFNLSVFLFFWDAVKAAAVGVFAPIRWVGTPSPRVIGVELCTRSSVAGSWA